MTKQLRVRREDTGEEVRPGDVVTDFRDDAWIYEYATRMRVPGKSGKVVVREPGTESMRELYDTVFGLAVEAVES